ncbi:protein-L-isoaspartate(D-aspartate) O-methyltransferase [Kushneria aurantia]|uniref:Protein-L-isoaspartate O-methyltransferase n=1 Tax=Kushneria aurantia TaxID=504092 RepID=A0ABV6FZ09_9GAMM|nr:protein-L-isoaspartate(D-aspartate) O-methyltransferase [Kushneria aurantia]
MISSRRRRREELVERLRQRGIVNERVLEAMARVPRHLFIDEALGYSAYEDTALPLGGGQTISQPFMVARMTELAIADNPASVLEVGTGSGYQARVLAELVARVYSIERSASLARRARACLELLGPPWVHLEHGDGCQGWPTAAPFDAIMLTAVAPQVPPALIDQTRIGGVIIAPLGDPDGEQWLTRIVRTRHAPSIKRLEPVCFVPLQTGVE